MADLENLKKADADPHSGTLFAYSYHSEGDKLAVIKKFYDQFEDKMPVAPDKEKVVQAFFTAFMNENALNPLVFPSLRYVDVSYCKYPHLNRNLVLGFISIVHMCCVYIHAHTATQPNKALA